MKNLTLALITVLLFSCKAEKKEIPLSKPNVVFIFADDMTYSAINALGNKEIKTPNLDKLVHNGTTFTHAFNMGGWNGAICAASRAMIISGRKLWEVNEFRENWSNGKEFDKTWGKLMEGAGYDTYMTGKWHVDAKAQNVFQNVIHTRPGMPGDAWAKELTGSKFSTLKENGLKPADIMPIGYNRPQNENDTTWTPTNMKHGGFWQGGKHWSEVLRDDALGFIDQTKTSKNPFFMYLAFNAPHDPRQAPKEFVDMYSLDDITIPESFLPLYPYKDGMGNGPSLRDEALAPFPRTEFAVKVHTKEYYALITHLDFQIGKIIEGLEKTGKMDNTYIIFTADHGLAVGKHGLIGKQSQFDHSIRAPFMIVGPKIPKYKKIDTDIYLQDAMATSLELAGVKKPEYVFFNSVLDLVNGDRKESHYDAIYNGYIDLQRMIRKDGYKLILYPKMDVVLLYDLKADPKEMNDLAANPEYKEKVDTMFAELMILQKDMEDTLDISSVLKNYRAKK
ncbi:sulfatase-like hydrolase/transferase [Zobellia nedashkovskayae]|uniref:sulfatase-like hydrolase/transferase n=1 Tax=Zobellia nedashkovskayae TaxID=2779510 RepID=UPI001D04F610|nr:sulfatase-like hydrolase/transferase [Zobellia nedashkovskayae]